MAEVLNECFSSVFTTEDISSLPVPFTKFEGNKSEHLGQLFVTSQTSQMIAKKIKKMKHNKSPGFDGVPPKLLKEIVEQISAPHFRYESLFRICPENESGFYLHEFGRGKQRL